MRTYTHTHTREHTQAYTHALAHKDTHTHIHTHTYLQDHRPHVRRRGDAARQEAEGREPLPVLPRGGGARHRRLLRRQEVRLGIPDPHRRRPLSAQLPFLHLGRTSWCYRWPAGGRMRD